MLAVTIEMGRREPSPFYVLIVLAAMAGARGQAGPYTTIASYITAEEKFGYAELPISLQARDGTVVADDEAKVRFEELGTYTE